MTLALLWLPILLSAVFVFIASALINMLLRFWHGPDYRRFSNEDEVRAAIRAGDPAPGQYSIPWCGPDAMKDPAMQEKFVQGPVGMVNLRRAGTMNLGTSLLQWFLFCILVSVLCALVALVLPAGADPHPWTRFIEPGNPNLGRADAETAISDTQDARRGTTLARLSARTHPRRTAMWSPRVFGFGIALVLIAAFAAEPACATDIHDAAVAHSGRSSADLKRDVTDKPATVLRFAGIKPGMQVADFLGYEGYYSELLSYIVGPSGHVLLLNNKAYDDFANNSWRGRIGNGRLPNVEHRTVDLAHMGLAPDSLDAVIMIKVYHDLYWVAPQDGWPKVDVGSVLDQVQRALKPGGVLLVVDHSAKPGTGNKDAGTLHRIDEAYARKDFEAHGFEFVKASDALRNPTDKRDTISYKRPALGHTDRFMLLFRTPPQ